MSELDLEEFESFLKEDDVDAAKRLVTQANVHTRDREGYGVLWYFCRYGVHDDPSLLYHFLELGAALDLESACKRTSLLHQAAAWPKPRILRALLDLDTPVDILDRYEDTPMYLALFFGRAECMRLLLDAGAQLSLLHVGWHIPDFIREFVSKREQTRESSIAVLGLLRCKSQLTGKNGNDVLRIVARCLWSLRGL